MPFLISSASSKIQTAYTAGFNRPTWDVVAMSTISEQNQDSAEITIFFCPKSARFQCPYNPRIQDPLDCGGIQVCLDADTVPKSSQSRYRGYPCRQKLVKTANKQRVGSRFQRQEETTLRHGQFARLKAGFHPL